jgi:hypothetical protein
VKKKAIPAIRRLRPADPKDTAWWEVAVHEAAHAVLFAYAGAARIAITLKACYLLLREEEIPLSFLAAAYGGYAADIEINGLTAQKALLRAQKDTRIAHIASQEPNERRRAELHEQAIADAIRQVRRFKKEILSVAKKLKTDKGISETEFEKIPVVREIRHLGIAERTKASNAEAKRAPLPKWIPGFLDQWGRLRVQQANDFRQRSSAHETEEPKALFLQLADKYEKCGQELLRIAHQGTDEEMEHAYHDIVHGPPKTLVF